MTGTHPKGIALREKLRQMAIGADDRSLTVGTALRQLAVESDLFGVALLLLSFPAALPIAPFGLKSLLGLIVVLLGLQMLVGKKRAWLPARISGLRLRVSWTRRVGHLGERMFFRIERFVRPRMAWATYRRGASLLGLPVIFLGLILILSIIPGSKILAALVLLALSLGMIENDGLITMLAVFAALILAALFAETVYLLLVWLTA